MPQLRLHYTTVGEPSGEPVLVLHGTAGSGAGMLTSAFAGELFGPGQPLDARKYFIILPDAIGAGQSSKPSDGLRTKFPRYNYEDMIAAQYLLVTQGLQIRHLRLVIGNSMGGMHTWLWGLTYPEFMDALVPMASQPSEMAGRNWMLRRLLIDAIRSDPDWKNGNYATQPRALRSANVFFGIATSGGAQGLYQLAPSRAQADRVVAELKVLGITATLLAINSADDERNPPELGIMEPALKRVKNARFYLIPAGPETRGHGTTALAKFWKAQLADLLASAPARATKGAE